MTLQEFADRFGWPPAKVSRIVRGQVFETVFGTDEPGEETLRAEEIDQPLADGAARIRKPAGRVKLHYQISAPDRLEQWLAGQPTRPPLGEEEIGALLEAAWLLIQTAEQEGGDWILPGTGQLIPADQMKTLRAILRRAGRSGLSE